MKVLYCPNCGANIELDEKKEFGFCMYCGTKIMLKETVNVVHSGSVKIDSASEVEKLLKDASFLISQDEIGHARDLYFKITQQYPRDYRGWLGEAKTSVERIFEDLWNDSYHVINYKWGDNGVQKKYQTAMSLVDDDLKKKITSEYDKIRIYNERRIQEKALIINKMKNIGYERNLLQERVKALNGRIYNGRNDLFQKKYRNMKQQVEELIKSLESFDKMIDNLRSTLPKFSVRDALGNWGIGIDE